MFTVNPFASLSVSLSPPVMQAYVVAMVAMVALVMAGTLLDIAHEHSARNFFDN